MHGFGINGTIDRPLSGLSMESNGVKWTPGATEIIDASPCKLRPDTGFECPIISISKDNPVCQSCELLQGKNPGLSHFDALALKKIAVASFDKFSTKKTATSEKQSGKHWCIWPDCGIPIARGRYCAKHKGRASSRKANWKRCNTGPIPEWYLYAPVQSSPGKKIHPIG